MLTKIAEEKKLALDEGLYRGRKEGLKVGCEEGLQQGHEDYLHSEDFAHYKKVLKMFYIDEVIKNIEEKHPE